jgi:hypothetical protein
MDKTPSRCTHCPLAAGLEVASVATHEVLTTNEKLFTAIGAHDGETLAQVSAPEFYFETADGMRGDRAAWIEGVRTMPYKIPAITNEDMVLRLDGDRAVLCGVQRCSVIVDGETVQDEQMFCDRWEKQNGRWLVIYAGVPPKAT